MKLGMDIPAVITDSDAFSPVHIAEYVSKVESYGFESCWMGEHIVRPDSFEYSRPESLTTLAAATASTDTVTVGSAILLLPLRNPVLAAKAAATIHWLSQGRFTLGVGMGYVEEDFDAVSVPFEERSGRFTEGIDLLRRLLHEESVTFDGEYYQVEDVTIEPILDDPPRILLAGGGIERDGKRFVPRAVKERILHADGWIATSGATPEMAAHDWNDFAAFLHDNGRDPDEYYRVASDRVHLVPEARSDEAVAEQRVVFERLMGDRRGVTFAEERYSFGSVDDIVDSLTGFADAGFDETKILIATLEPDEIMKQLEYWNEYVRPQFS